MQFYKKRDFGELISATFDFLKVYGKNYFKNFIIINGIILILLMLVFYIGFGEVFQQMFSSNMSGQQFYFEEYFTENVEVFIIAMVLFVVLFVLLSLVSYSFPILYMKRVSETGNQQVTSDEMMSDLKSIIPKFFIFFLGLILVVVPLAIVVFLISSLLMVILIGFVLIIIFIPAFMNMINFALFHYYHTNDGYFSSLSYGLNAQFSKSFWKYWGSLAIIYIMIQVITTIFTFIPMMMMMGTGFVGSGAADPDGTNFMAIIVIVVYAISLVASFILMNLIYINSGFMYYDSRLDLHRDMQFSEIDSLGQREV